MPQTTKKLAKPIQQIFRVDEKELALIHEKMEAARISNKHAYYRKMVLDGYVVRIDFSDVREMVRLLGISSNNLNQVAKNLNSGGSVHAAAINALQEDYEKLWVQVEMILKKLIKL